MPDPTVATATLAVATVTAALLELLPSAAWASALVVALEAENLFLRRQQALLLERGVKPRRADRSTALVMALTSRLFKWREALVVVTPATLVRWQRLGFKLLWARRSRPGRPALPVEVRRLIRRLALENPSWGEERIAAELLLKLGLKVSPRTVGRYMPPRRGNPRGDQRWMTFVRNHARAIVATDLCSVVTARFQVLYVLVLMEVGSRRILHTNVTAHPTSAWVAQQLRNAIPDDHAYRFLLHDRDAVFSAEADQTAKGMGLRVLRAPVRAPRANAFAERVIGTLRRECLDWLIPLNEKHVRLILREWTEHYNRARPHSSLGPGIPDPPEGLPVALQAHRHRLPAGSRVAARPVLGGLHHEYRLVA